MLASFADLHLNLRVRLAECRRVVHWLIDDAAARGVRLFLVPGDLVHARSDPAERVELRAIVRHLTNVAPAIVISGNHDVPHDLAILDAFAGRHPLIVHEQPAIVHAVDTTVACLPDPRRADLVTAITARGETVTSESIAAEARRRIAAIAAELAERQGPRVLIAHAMMADAVMCNDQPPPRGGELLFTNADFAVVPADLFLFGHVHRAQRWRIGSKPAAYPGAPYSTTYGELGRKSYLVADWHDDHYELTEVPTPATRLVLLVAGFRPEDGELDLRFGREHRTEVTPVLSDCDGADVRLRVEHAPEAKPAAMRAAEALRERILAAGAVACKPESDPRRTQRERAPSYAAARTTRDKVVAWWDATGDVPPGDERLALLDMLATLTADEPTARPGLLGLRRLAWQGIGTLVAPGELRLDDLPPVVAVVGPTGAGKSTLLSMFHLAAWGDSPRGSLDDFAGPGARIAADLVTTSGTWQIEHVAKSKTVTVTTADGTFSGGRDGFKEWVADRLPARGSELLERCLWLPPRSTGIADLYDGPLKGVLLEIAGAEQLEALREQASARAKAEDKAAAAAAAELRAMGTVDAATALAARDKAASAERAAVNADRAAKEALRVARARAGALAELARAEAAEADLRRRLAELRDAASDGHAIRDAVELGGEIERESAALRAASAASRRLASAESTNAASATREAAEADAEATAHDRNADEHAVDADLRARVTAAIADLPALDAAVTSASAAERAAGAAGRIEALRGAMIGARAVAASGRLKVTVAGAGRALIDVVSRLDAGLKADDAAGGIDLATLRSRTDEATACAAAARTLAARAPAIEAADRLRSAAWDARREARARRGRAEAEAARARRLAVVWGLIADACAALTTNLAQAGEPLAPLIARSHDLATAQAAAVEIAAQVDRAGAETARARAAIPAAPADALDEADADAAATAAAAELATAIATAARASDAYDRAVLGSMKAARLREEQARATLAATRWARLAKALGRDGAQALEADLVGQEIADVATELLAGGQTGATWSVRFDSTRAGGPNKKRQVEQARWTSIHLPSGKEREVRMRSGGEEVLSAAGIWIGSVFALLRRRGAPEGGVLLGCDEPASALRAHPLQPQHYVEDWIALLRRGAELVGAKNVVIVPPDDARVADLCDACIVVEPVAMNESVVRVE